MNKRVLVIFALCVLSLGLLSLRILSIDAGEYAEVGVYKSSRRMEISRTRGRIYDRNMEPMVNNTELSALVMKPTISALNYVKPYVGTEKLSDLRTSFGAGSPCVMKLPTRIFEKSVGDVRVVEYKRRYADKQYCTHLIGYLDSSGSGVSGIEKCYNSYLNENSGILSAAFYVDAKGRDLSGLDLEIIDDNYDTSAGVALTIDMKVQKAVENSLDRYGIDSGCAVAMDPKTGAIRAMASRPNFNPMDVASSLKEKNSPLVNKTLSAYSVGSTFKVVVAAAALEKSLENGNLAYTCTGGVDVFGTKISCFGGVSHGVLNMEEALVNSCNSYFINLINYIGAEDVLEMAKKMGYGEPFLLASGLVSSAGNLPSLETLSSPVAQANLGFGQGELLATPIQIATAFSAIANGGYFVSPYVYFGLVSSNMELSVNPSLTNDVKEKKRIMSTTTSESLKNMLFSVVEKNEKGKPENTNACGKTATAETGQIINGKNVCHTWFAGWFPVDEPQLVIVIMKENGTTGISDCAPVFKNIVDTLVDIE